MNAKTRTKTAKAPKQDGAPVALSGAGGRFLPGTPSANPKGRGLEAYRLGDLAKAHTGDAIKTLAEIMGDKKQPGQTRINAATALVDRAFGRPSISVEAKIETTDFTALHLTALRQLAGIRPDGGSGDLIDVTPTKF